MQGIDNIQTICASEACILWLDRHLRLFCSDEVILEGECSANLVLKWMTEVGSSIYATPLIHDLYSDGQKDVIVPSFVHYLEASPLIHTQEGNSRFPSLHASITFNICSAWQARMTSSLNMYCINIHAMAYVKCLAPEEACRSEHASLTICRAQDECIGKV